MSAEKLKILSEKCGRPLPLSQSDWRILLRNYFEKTKPHYGPDNIWIPSPLPFVEESKVAQSLRYLKDCSDALDYALISPPESWEEPIIHFNLEDCHLTFNKTHSRSSNAA